MLGMCAARAGVLREQGAKQGGQPGPDQERVPTPREGAGSLSGCGVEPGERNIAIDLCFRKTPDCSVRG